MVAAVLDGAATAQAIKEELRAQVQELAGRGLRPGLGVLLVGDNPASAIYVRSKTRSCEELGIHHETVRLPASAIKLDRPTSAFTAEASCSAGLPR